MRCRSAGLHTLHRDQLHKNLRLLPRPSVESEIFIMYRNGTVHLTDYFFFTERASRGKEHPILSRWPEERIAGESGMMTEGAGDSHSLGLTA